MLGDDLDALRTSFFETKISLLEETRDEKDRQAYNRLRMVNEDLQQHVDLLVRARNLFSIQTSCLDAAREQISSSQLLFEKTNQSLKVALGVVAAYQQRQAVADEAAEAAAIAASASAELLAVERKAQQKAAKRRY